MNARTTIFGSRYLGRAGSICALCACVAVPALGQDTGGGEDEPVEVTDYGTITVSVQDTELADILEMLSIQSERNIIASKNVSAVIPSINLFDVTFHEALDAILHPNGYGYVEEGNFIYIYTLEEIEQMKEAQRTTESRIFELEYLSAADAFEFVSPLLSDVGRAVYRGDVEPGIEADASAVGEDSYAFVAKLLVTDYPERLDEIAERLGELDTPPQQVLIEATILQTQLDESNAFGIDFSLVGSVDFTDLTDPLSGVGNLLNGNDDTEGFQPSDNEAYIGQSTVGNTPGAGGFKIGIIKDEFSIFLRALDQVTDSTVLARPKIMALNRQRAEVLVGARIGYLSTTATETSSTESVEYLDTGVKLIFRPFISRNGMIRLELAPSVSEASLRTVTNTRGIAVTIPDEFTNEITANVRIKDGQTLVLGGLFRESNTVTRNQVPVLGDIPLVGAAFKGQDDVLDRSEIIFLITPSIVHDEALWALGDDALDYANHAILGARKGLLPFSRDRQTISHNQRAVDAFNRGEVDKALYYVNSSLRLNENQPEMVKFRQRVMGTKQRPHERSVLERIMQKELDEFTPPEASAYQFDPENETAVAGGMMNRTLGAAGSSNDANAPSTAGQQMSQTPGDDSYMTSEADGQSWTDFDEAFTYEDWFINGGNSDDSMTANGSNEADEFIDDDEQAMANNDDGFESETDSSGPSFTMSEEEKDRFIERFLHDYFVSVGLAYMSPFEDTARFNDENDEFPFGRFDQNDADLAEVDPDDPID
jgi:type IV pilus assembly protein PilQ